MECSGIERGIEQNFMRFSDQGRALSASAPQQRHRRFQSTQSSQKKQIAINDVRRCARDWPARSGASK